MAGLQRSTTSFRRQGSSGLVWNDQFISGDLNKMRTTQQKQQQQEGAEFSELRPSRSVGSIGLMERRPSTTTKGHAYRKVKVVSTPNKDPPSPKFTGCGFCSAIFGKQVISHQPQSNKHRAK
ncbi:uncharacterized protein CFP56_032272 [Quercus suber]|uniref:MAPK kinase substrate protein n=1 Tax=Quercus suber TaxID=58331 RepID=A0AAW0LTM5_QUESU|nr:uncharacterized protein At1g15400-like [Quercus suber]